MLEVDKARVKTRAEADDILKKVEPVSGGALSTDMVFILVDRLRSDSIHTTVSPDQHQNHI